MAVRDALLGILTLGPAYGLQLHAELGIRAPHRAQTNVGQVYGTLERLSKAELVSSAGENAEGLPLYQLTPQGFEEATSWLSGDDIQDLPSWDDLLDLVLISRSVSAEAASALLAKLFHITHTQNISLGTLSGHAHARYVAAVNGWLEDVSPEITSGELAYSSTRAKRGRPAKKA